MLTPKQREEIAEECNLRVLAECHKTKEFWMKEILNWINTPKEERKPANLSFTAGHERNICYAFENLEFEIKRLREALK